MKKFLTFIFIFLTLLAPAVSSAAGDIVPCNGPDCNFDSFITLINNIIKFMLFKLALPICAIMFAYAGFLMVTAGESSSEARGRAKGIFWNAVLGLCFAVTCWIIVHSIFVVLGYNGSWIGL